MGTDAQPEDHVTDETADASGEATDQEDTRSRFREALEKKQQRQHKGASGSGSGNQSPHVAPAKRGRTFRRKSG